MFWGFQDSQEESHLDVRDRTIYTQHSYCRNEVNYHAIKFELFKPEALTKGTRDSVIAADLGLGRRMKRFSPTRPGNIMPGTLPYGYDVLTASVWKLTVSLNFLNVSSVCSSSLLMKIISKNPEGGCSMQFLQTQNISSNSLFLFLYYNQFKHAQSLESQDALSTAVCREWLKIRRIAQLLIDKSVFRLSTVIEQICQFRISPNKIKLLKKKF